MQLLIKNVNKARNSKSKGVKLKSFLRKSRPKRKKKLRIKSRKNEG